MCTALHFWKTRFGCENGADVSHPRAIGSFWTVHNVRSQRKSLLTFSIDTLVLSVERTAKRLDHVGSCWIMDPVAGAGQSRRAARPCSKGSGGRCFVGLSGRAWGFPMPKMDGLYFISRKSHLEMDDKSGYPHGLETRTWGFNH